MSATPEDRLLSASELEIVAATREPEIGKLSLDELKSIGRRLRQAHERARDIGARQQREMRAKAEPHGVKPARDNTGTVAKAQALLEALHRLDAELSRREKADAGSEAAKPSQAELARHALELKLAGEADHHPDAGRSSSDGLKAKQRKTPAKIGTTKKEVGRVSQANKVAQARKDSPK